DGDPDEGGPQRPPPREGALEEASDPYRTLQRAGDASTDPGRRGPAAANGPRGVRSVRLRPDPGAGARAAADHAAPWLRLEIEGPFPRGDPAGLLLDARLACRGE